MPWKLHKKPLLIISIFGYLDYAHRILHRIKALDRKYYRLVIKELNYIKQVLVIARESFRLTNDVEFVRFRTQLNLHICEIELHIEFSYLPRFLELVNEMPLKNKYALHIVGTDESGSLTEFLLLKGLKNIQSLEAATLNLSIRDVAIENFLKQIATNKSLKKLHLIVPQNSSSSFKQCLLALSTNDSIVEISLDRLDLLRVTGGNPNHFPVYELSRLLSKSGLVTLNLDF